MLATALLATALAHAAAPDLTPQERFDTGTALVTAGAILAPVGVGITAGGVALVASADFDPLYGNSDDTQLRDGVLVATAGVALTLSAPILYGVGLRRQVTSLGDRRGSQTTGIAGVTLAAVGLVAGTALLFDGDTSTAGAVVLAASPTVGGLLALHQAGQNRHAWSALTVSPTVDLRRQQGGLQVTTRW